MVIFSISHKDKKVFFTGPERVDYITEKIKTESRFYESDLLEWLEKLSIPKGDIIDVGANIGNHSIFFALFLDRHVWYFEPNKPAFEILRSNVKVNKIHNITLLEYGLSSSPGRASIKSSDNYNIGAAKTEVDVNGVAELRTLDDSVDKAKRISIIKIDVEGFELEVLKGAEKTIREHKPLIMVECINSNEFSANSDFLLRRGYVPKAVFGATPIIVFSHKDNDFVGSAGMDINVLLKMYIEQHDVSQKFRDQQRTSKLEQKNPTPNSKKPSVQKEHKVNVKQDSTIIPNIKFGNHILVTMRYPSKDDLYSYAFIHSRVKAYKKEGLKVDVFKINEDIEKLVVDEFEDVRVFSGSVNVLSELLKQHKYENISTHLMTPLIWSAIEPFAKTIPIFVWLHGVDIQLWHRRSQP